MTSRSVIRLFLVLGVSLLAVSIGGSTAVAAPPETVTSCTTIDSSGEYVLGSNLDGSSNATCIEITSSDVILDGDGHSIDDGESDGDIGIHVNGSVDTPLDNVTVRNLTVEGSDVFTTVGIKVGDHTSGTTLEDISVTNWTRGIQFRGDDGRIDAVTVDNVFDTDASIQRRGLVVFGSNNTVTNTSSYGERPFQIEGTNNTVADSVADLGPILVFGDHNTLTNNTGDTTNTGASFAVEGDYNTLSDNVMDGTNGGTFYGVRIQQGSHNTITGNILTETDESGIYIKNSDNNTLAGNNVTGAYRYGVELDSAPNTTIRDSVADDARVDGIHSSSSADVVILNTTVNNVGEEGIWMSGATRSVLDNVTAKDTDRFGNDHSAIEITGTSEVVVRNSTVSNTDSHGIHVITSDSPLVEKNTVENVANSFDEYGIYIESQGSSAVPDATIRNNTVIDSYDNGIHLDWGVDAMVTGNDVRNPAGSTSIAGITIKQGSSNVTVANNTLNATQMGIELFGTDNSTVQDNHAFDIGSTPLWIQAVNDSTFTRNRLNGGSYTGVAIDGLDNVIYDNHINNSDYVDSRGSGANAWNTPKQAGENIVGSPYIGGNYYATPAGDGFSETCTDGNDDGICDNELTHFSGNIDYLPLATPPGPTVIRINKSGSGDYTTIQHGIDNATDGDTVEVQPGTYTETVTVDKNITLVAPNGATLNGSSFGTDSTGIYVDKNVSSGLTIDGFTIESYEDGISVGASTTETSSDDSYEFDGTAGGWVIQNVVVRDNAQDGIDVAGTTTAAWTIDNVTATSNGDEGLEIGYEVNGVDPNQDWIVSNVTASRNGEYGIRVGYEQGAWTIENTITNDNGDSSESGVQVYQSGSNWSIADYTATGNDGSGIDVASGDAGLIERANLSENRQFGLEALTDGDWTLRDSLVLNNDEDGVYDSNTASSFLVDNVTIRGNGHDGVFLLDNSGDWQILDSVIENNGATDSADRPGAGIDAERTSGSWAVNNTSITGNDGAGIYAVDGPFPYGDATDNWWGQSSGPTVDQCQGNVTCSAYLSSEPGTTDGSTQTNTTVSKINLNTSEVFVENAVADIGVSIPLYDTDAGNATGVQYSGLNVTTTQDATYNLTVETNQNVFDSASALNTGDGLLYANISHPDLADGDIEEVVFNLTVNASELPQGAAIDDIALYRYGVDWTMLSTTQVSQSGEIYELRATSPGLSVFAVALTADITVSPNSPDFGSIELGTTTNETINITNDGSADLDVNDITLSGFHSDSFTEDETAVTIGPGSSSEFNLTFAPTSTGPKDADLVIESNDPDESSVSVVVYGKSIDTTDPVADITMNDTTPSVGEDVLFDASGSTDANSIASYEWELGDGTTTTGVSTTHAYGTTGNYSVNITVTDGAGNTNTASESVTVTSATSPVDKNGTAKIRFSGDGVEGLETASVTLSDSLEANVTVQPSTGPTGGAPTPDNDNVTVYFDISADIQIDNETQIEISVKQSKLDTLTTPTLLHYLNGEWRELETTLSGNTLSATSSGLSPFAVAEKSTEVQSLGSTDSSGGSSGSSSSSSSNRQSGEVTDGTPPTTGSAEIDEEGRVTVIPNNGKTVKQVNLTIPGGSGQTSVSEITGLPEGVPEPDGTSIVWLNISAPDPTDDAATVQLSVNRSIVEGTGTEPKRLQIQHYTNGNWDTLRTVLVSVEDEIVLEASVSSFSPFAVTASDSTIPDSNGDTVVVDGEKIEPNDRSGTDDSAETEASDENQPEIESSMTDSTPEETPGFGILVALLALVVLSVFSFFRSKDGR